MKNILIFSLLAMSLVACTGKSKRQDSEDSSQSVSSTSNEENIISPEETAENKTSDALLIDERSNDPAVGSAAATTGAAAPVITENSAYNDMPTGQIETKTYKVSKSETLMLIAFKLYGDYGKWKELRELNKDKLKKGMTVRAGMELKYNTNGEEFVWDQKGNPHLIRHGETLGIISKEVYGRIKRWKDIWENNKPMIKDPNKIFAGFTLYYIPDSKNVALQ